MSSFISQIRRFHQTYLRYYGNSKSMLQCLKQGLFSYHPSIDVAIFREFPKNMKPEVIVRFWNDTFVRYRSDKKYIRKIFRLLVYQPDIYYLPYLVFQHELRSHRFPLSISFVGTMLVFNNSIANQCFLKALRARKMGKFKERAKFPLILSKFEQNISNLLLSSRCVLEGLALFNHYIFLGIILQEKKTSRPAKMAFKLITEIIHMNKKFLADAQIYEIGFQYAMKIYEKFGRWGVEIASMYALNPIYNMISPYQIPQNYLPMERFISLSKIPIETQINRDESKDVLEYIQSKLGWDGWEASRDLILSRLSEELAKSSLPSKDFIRPAGSGSHYIPEMILIFDQKSNLCRVNESDLIPFFENFVFTLFRKKHEILLKRGVITRDECPIKLLYSTCEKCLNFTKGLAHNKVLKVFGEEFEIKVPD